MRLLKPKKQTGQSLAEYGLIMALIAVVSISQLGNLGTSISGSLGQLGSAIASGASSASTPDSVGAIIDSVTTAPTHTGGDSACEDIQQNCNP